ncbi:MAG: ABC transporter permease [Blastocatellia bacterium]|nr:ABC transporter permease [Blastocatellia bacterium]
MGTFWQDLRYGGRVLLKKPGFTFVAVLTLALGIGANTAIFSVVNGLLLRPLPYPEADRLVVMAEGTRDGERMSVSYPNYKDWQEQARSFEEMAAFRRQSFSLTEVEKPVHLQGRIVNWNFFRLLGVQPQLGRMFSEQDDKAGATPTAIISNGLWKDQFGGDTEIVGRNIRMDGDRFTVIGVLPPDFEFFRRDDIFVPLGLYLVPQFGMLDRGNHFGLYALARLKDGVRTEQARAEMETLTAKLEREYPDTNSGNSAITQKLSDRFVEDIRPALLVLFCAVMAVLLIACVNVANLLLVRATERQKEIAIRLALGAGRSRIIRQLMGESLLISGLGGVGGLLIGMWMMDGLLALAPQDIPQLSQVELDSSVMAFTFGISVLTGVLFGMLPALHASRADLHSVLKEGGRTTAGSGREKTRGGLLVAEVSLALVLLVGAGLMLRTVFQLTRVDPGFNAENLLTMQFSLPGNTYNAERRRVFYGECLSRVGALPGVRAAALTLSLPIDGSNWSSVFITGDKPVPPRAELPSADFTPVSANYFDAMGIRLLKGRPFTEADNENSTRVTVIDELMAQRLWPNEDPIGKRLKQGWPESETEWREVIGVVADTKLNGVDRETPLQSYLPLAQVPFDSLILVVRTTGNPLAMASTVEQAIHTLDPDLPVFAVRTMDQLMGDSIAQQRLTLILLAGFAFLALVLASVGIYGVISYSVSQRTHEIGIRMALGARAGDVLRLVLGRGMLLTLTGVAIGMGAAFALTRLISSLLFEVSATDPVTFAIVPALLIAVALLACYIPARRAARVDPMVALRYE